MDFITTNIRLPRDDYLRLKKEAAEKQKSFSFIVRERLADTQAKQSEKEIEKILALTKQIATEGNHFPKATDSVQVVREMRKTRYGSR